LININIFICKKGSK